MRALLLACLLALYCITACVPDAEGAPVYGTDVGLANYTGSRSAPDLIVSGISTPVAIDWKVSPLALGSWFYEYTFSRFGPPEVSHIILDLTDDALDDPLAVVQPILSSGTLDAVERGSFGPGPGNPGFPVGTSIVGVTFETDDPGTSFVLSFTSNRAPVWGDIYLKGGSASYVYNAGLLDRESESIAAFIARPNGVLVPEPTSLVLIGVGPLALTPWIRRRR